VAIVASTAIYVLAYRQAGRFPSASGLVGHGIGIVGFILMLLTATLYSIRKRLTDVRWGSMAAWLRFHMVTGLVGPYMVLLHTAMRFHGLAGLAMLLTVVVVISGLIGRYIYTAVPRVIEGAEPDVSSLNRRFVRAEASSKAPASRGTASVAWETASAATLDPSSPLVNDEMGGTRAVPAGGRSLDQGFERLAARRRRLATWRSIHLPLTWALFVTAVVHMVAALYYVGR
jgi:hypothetical protein